MNGFIAQKNNKKHKHYECVNLIKSKTYIMGNNYIFQYISFNIVVNIFYYKLRENKLCAVNEKNVKITAKK